MKQLFQHKKIPVILTFFIVYTLYMWLWINPSLYLIRSYPAFFTDTYFLREYFDFPGNPVAYISWSGNSRWFVFSSRRLDGMTSKPFICHIDKNGTISKPFIIPQKDPYYYKTDHRNFSRPELLKEKSELTFSDFSNVIFNEPEAAKYKEDSLIEN